MSFQTGNERIRATITMELNIESADLQKLIETVATLTAQKINLPTIQQPANVPSKSSDSPRLAYSINETADMLGISPKTVYRLIHRGLLKPSLALRHKLIPKQEIERFLAQT